MKKLENKVAIITGGASGIGKAAVRLFVREGARVVISDILDDLGETLANDLGENAAYFHTDVSDEADVSALIDFACKKFGKLDIMFNNAGIAGVMDPIETIPVEAFDRTMAVVLRGVFLGIKHAMRVMKPAGTGCIINNASVAGLQAGHADHIYSSAKAAVIHMTRSMAMEAGEAGVRINCICPGWIATPIMGKTAGLSQQDAEKTLDKVKDVLSTFQPVKRAGTPEDIAQAALWLAGDESGFVNGHSLIVDGGLANGRMWSTFFEDTMPLVNALGL